MRPVVAVGGGHGLAMTIRGLAAAGCAVTAAVATTDDGGSSGRLRRELDIPAVGDLRRCVTTLASDREVAARFEHRFDRGSLDGHAVGNAVLAGFLTAGDDLVTATERFARLVGVADQHRILPVTDQTVTLVGSDGQRVVCGQVAFEEAGGLRDLSFDPSDVTVPAAVTDAIAGATLIVIGPGSLYTSVLAAAAVPGVRQALAAADAPVAYVANLRADETEAPGPDVAAHVAALRGHGVEPDVVVAGKGALPVGDLDGTDVRVVDVARPHGLAHDSHLLAQVLTEL